MNVLQLGGSLVTAVLRVFGLRVEGRPTDMSSCEYIEYATVDSWQGVDFHLVHGVRRGPGLKVTSCLRNFAKGFELGRIL
jgi:hypothetical protein